MVASSAAVSPVRGLSAVIALVSLLSCAVVQAQRTVTLAPAVAGEPRVALVVGNASYKGAPLLNPVNDANDVAQALRDLGFKVILLRDANTREMRQAIREWSAELRRARVGLFYFAGHGVQIRGNNYLLPIATELESEADVEDLAIDTGYAMRSMEESQVPVSIVILDACRNNPFSRNFRSPSRGLAQMTAAKGTVIAFSTAPGSVAADGAGRNGTYTRHLLESLRHPDTDILKVFQRTRASVVKETAGLQVPWESTSLIGEFHFRMQGGSAQIALSIQSTPPQGAVAPPQRFDTALDSPTFLEDLDDFIKQQAAPVSELQRLADTGDPLASARWCAAGTHERFNLGIRLEEGLAHCKRLADQGVGVGLFLHGRAHMIGRGVPKDLKEAMRLYRVGAEKGSTLAMNAIGALNAGLMGYAADSAEALRWFRRAAEGGSPLAMVNLGAAYMEARGVAKDEQEAVRWFRKAAEMREPSGMRFLGQAYKDGMGVAKDDAEAMRWFLRSAEAGNDYAMGEVGIAYSMGRGLKQDPHEAARWYRRAADRGNLTAQYNLALMYYHGRGGLPKDPAQAARLYRMAADQGVPAAMTNLALQYRDGIGIAKDEAEALRLFREAAGKGNSVAMNHLGILYANGRIVDKDYKEAARWYRKAADAGDAGAMSNLGHLYFVGDGVRQDDDEAARWFTRAAELGNASGMLNLGVAHETGRGVAKDVERAASWYRKVLASNDEEARAKAERNLRRLGK
jgi:TPR repeat protein